MACPPLIVSILRNPPSLASARIVSTLAGMTTPAPWQALGAGDQQSIQFSICDGQGNLETLTGRTYRVGIGSLNAPVNGGSFTLADVGGATTAPQLYNIAASTLAYYLNLLNGNLGPSNGTVQVEGPNGGPFRVIWNVNGSRGLLTANVTDLTPEAIAVISEIQAGSGSQPEIQLVRLLQMPYALQSSWTVSGTTATGVLNISSAGLYEWLAQNPQGPLFFEIEENDGATIKKILQAPILVNGEAIPYTSISSLPGQSSNQIQWLPFCLALTGGVAGPPATSLNLIPTLNLPVTVTAVEFVNSSTGGLQVWQLVAGTNATGGGYQRPADYNASTNAKVWIEIQ